MKVGAKKAGLSREGARPEKAGKKDPLIGQVVARCKIEERIGEGRTSVVYRATHEGLGRSVAVKILLPEVLQYPDVVLKFEAEARAIAKLDHENILKIYDVSTDGDRHCIVMELLEGESLLDLVEREGPLDPVDAMRVIRQASLGLEAAHSKNIIHRDVKPQNLVLLKDGLVKVVDFGLATAADSELAAVRIGTPHYMAPEVCEAKTVEERSDVYSLGITLFHLLVGKPPYAGNSLKEILASHVEGRPLHPERQVMSLPKSLCDLVRDMTKRDALVRPQMSEVVEALDRIGGKELKVRQGLKTRRGGGGRRSSKTPLLAIGGGALVVVILLVVILMNRGSGGSQKPTPAGGGPGTPVANVPTPPPDTNPVPGVPPLPVEAVETPEQTAAREEREKKAAEEARKADAKKAFADVEDFARGNWDDKAAVVRAYKAFANTYSGLDLAKEATKRAKGIEKGDIHPHPDRTYAKKEEVKGTEDKWGPTGESRLAYEAALAAMDYSGALRLVPEGIDDPEGKLTETLEFFRHLANDLLKFRLELRKAAMEMSEGRRTITLEQGASLIKDATEAGLHVVVKGELKKLSWPEIPPDALGLLAARAFAGKEARLNVLLAAFCFAHKLKDLYWTAAATASSSGSLPKDAEQQMTRYNDRAEERLPK